MHLKLIPERAIYFKLLFHLSPHPKFSEKNKENNAARLF